MLGSLSAYILPFLFLTTGLLSCRQVRTQEFYLYPAAETHSPGERQIQLMQEAVVDYERMVHEGVWTQIEDGSVLRQGDRDIRTPLIRSKLARLGDLSDADENSPDQLQYTEEDATAVESFQRRHGLRETGSFDSQTRHELNVLPEARLRTLRLNLERALLIRPSGVGREVFVNIAGFELFGLRDGDLVLRLPVIVGKRYHKTPLFSSEITHLTLNPSWNVPASIAANEFLPKLKLDPSYLEKGHYKITSPKSDLVLNSESNRFWSTISRGEMSRYRIRQEPGPWNALGIVKFIFPNRYDVYLHDTPSKKLFDEEKRMFSHGCIRVKNPMDLAQYLLEGQQGGQNVDINRLNQMVRTKRERTIKLSKPVPIHVTYRTAWIDRDGKLNFRSDVYNRDRVGEISFQAD